tara:strand:+ start:4049 stop:5839 length:1791 start_codon:yes stop_codon:yes gene_type:complete
MKIFLRFFDLLTPNERKKAYYLFLMILLMGIIDVLGIGSILPFMAVIAQPDIIDKNIYISSLYSFSQANSKQEFYIFFGLIVFSILIFSLLFKSLTTFFQIKFVMMREYSISKRLVEGYLKQPYEWFLEKHSADLGKNVLSEVNALILNGFMPCLIIIANGVIVVFIIALLFAVDSKLSIISAIFVSIFYILTYKLLSINLSKYGELRLQSNKERFTAISETFDIIKEVKANNLEKFSLEKFSIPAKVFADNQTKVEVISQLPRFIFEAFAFGGMLLIMLYFISSSGNFNNVIPIISLFALAGYRILPSAQMIYRSVAQIKYITPVLKNVHEDIKKLNTIKNYSQDSKVINIKDTIEIKDLYFKYNNSDKNILKNINIRINVGDVIGLVGKTGSGKTTIVDILLGLLMPKQGELIVDGLKISSQNLKSWQSLIGYVPQDIYLIDGTIKTNIAIGVEEKDIDNQLLIRAAKIANLHDLVINEFKNGYNSFIGEKGVKLSGGQKQRIGIARAVYNDPKVLILDESTSSLDSITEKSVMESILKFNSDITVVIIAHSLNTLRGCNEIFVLENGEVIDKGNFGELSKRNDLFQSVVSLKN